MNFKKVLLCLVAIMATVVPVMAEGKYYASEELAIVVPPFVNMVRSTGSTTTSYENIADRRHLTIGTPLTPRYEIATNEDMKVHLSASANINSGEISALQGNDTSSMLIVFTKSDGSASAASVQSCLSGSARPSENPNAIAFLLQCNQPINSENNYTNVTVDNNHIAYDLARGTTVLSYSVSGSSISGTFSADDTAGLYRATLIVQDVAP